MFQVLATFVRREPQLKYSLPMNTLPLQHIPYLLLVEYFVIVVAYAVSLYAYTTVLLHQWRLPAKQKAPSLVLYLLVWICGILVSFPYVAYMLVTWVPRAGE